MAIHKGSEGVVKVGANNIGSLTSWSIETTAETLETTVMGNTARTYLPSLTSWSGSAEAYLDETDAAQTAMVEGAELVLSVYFEGETTSDTYYTGSVIVTGVSRSSSYDGLTTVSFSFQGTGALSISTVV